MNLLLKQLIGLGCWLLGSYGGSVSLRDDVAFETSDFMSLNFYSNPRAGIVGKSRSASGAWGVVNMTYDSTHSGKWYIEEQRGAAETIISGIIQRDQRLVNSGLEGLEWGARQQNPDGSFSCPDNFHSTSFYLEAMAHSCLILEASPYARRFRQRVEQLKSTARRAAQWMLQPEVLAAGRKRNNPYTHRRYAVAAAIGETGVWCGDMDLVRQSKAFIDEGLALQDSSGFNPEKGGYDVSYHSAGLLFAHRYYDIVADEQYRRKMKGMYTRGIKWMLTRVKPDGTVDPTGNTRTGLGQERSRNGHPKGITYASISADLYWWSQQTNDRSLAVLAQKIWEARTKSSTVLAAGMVQMSRVLQDPQY
ncbi:MAG TPA: hypothetical protein VGM31_11590 [Puia sp.]